MKKIQIGLPIVAALLAGATSASASLYDITFTGSGSTANGQIDVVGGVAQSGYLDVTAGPNQGTYNMVGGGGSGVFKLIDGTYLSYDNEVFVGSNPFLDNTGLAFANGPAQTSGTVGFNIWGDGANSYQIFGDPPWGSPYVYGVATLTPIPEPTTMVAGAMLLLPFGASTLRFFRKSARV